MPFSCLYYPLSELEETDGIHKFTSYSERIFMCCALPKCRYNYCPLYKNLKICKESSDLWSILFWYSDIRCNSFFQAYFSLKRILWEYAFKKRPNSMYHFPLLKNIPSQKTQVKEAGFMWQSPYFQKLMLLSTFLPLLALWIFGVLSGISGSGDW